jgi:HSP20 family protein
MRQQRAAVARANKNGQSLSPVSFEEFKNCRKEIRDLIARRAYEMFESRGRVHGHDLDDWFRAEAEKLHPIHAELSDAGHAFVAVIAVPGGHLEQLKFSADARSLWICGLPPRAESNADGAGEGPVISGSFLRSFRLPAEINPSEIRATIRDDLLRVNLPKVIPRQNGE